MFERIRMSPSPSTWRSIIQAKISVDVATGCWRWPLLDRYGYGRFWFTEESKTRYTGAHRAAWLAFVGPIEGDLVIDHLCRNRACCNVAHLELVTNAENTRRADHSRKAGRSGTRRDGPLHSCRKHGRSDGRLVTAADGYTRWVCRECHRGYKAARKARMA